MESRRKRSRSQILKWCCYVLGLFVCAALQTTPGLFQLGQAKPLLLLPLFYSLRPERLRAVASLAGFPCCAPQPIRHAAFVLHFCLAVQLLRPQRVDPVMKRRKPGY